MMVGFLTTRQLHRTGAIADAGRRLVVGCRRNRRIVAPTKPVAVK
jgi:hypothetical protein